MDEYTERLIEQKIAELSDNDFDALVAKTRAPRLTPTEAAQTHAAQLIRDYRS
jgi:hypothetical protein